MTDEQRDRLILNPVPGYEPEIGLLLAMPEETRGRTTSWLVLTWVAGESRAAALARLDASRGVLLGAFRGMSLANLRRVRSLPDYDVTPEYVLHHLAQHEAEHRGGIGMLRALATRH